MKAYTKAEHAALVAARGRNVTDGPVRPRHIDDSADAADDSLVDRYLRLWARRRAA